MLVDDHPLWREMLRQVLEHKRAGKVVAEASDGEEAVKLAVEIEPDVVIMDVDLPGIDGVEATRQLIAGLPAVKVLVLSGFEEKEGVIEAVRAGASGYLLKTAGAGEVAEAIRRVRSGEVVFPPSLASIVLEEFRRLADRDTRSAQVVGAAHLPPRRPRLGKARSQAVPVANAFIQEGEFWTLVYAGDVIRMKNSKGMGYLGRLLASPGSDLHVADLIAPGAGAGPASSRRAAEDGLTATGLGDAGPVIDPEARAAYRRRLEDLVSEVEEAEAWGDSERTARAREEMDFLSRELAAAVGLGGRDRRAASPVERFRISVTKAIRTAIARIRTGHPDLGTHLDRAVRTGTFCSYRPSDATEWIL